MKKNNIFRSFLLYVYFIALFVATAGTVNYIEELILFNLRTNVICSDAAGFLDVPLMIVLAFCVHHGLLKLYKRFFEKTKISLNKTQFRVLIACLVFSIVLAVYGFISNKTEIYSDGNIKRSEITEFNSNNTKLLNVEEVKEKLLSLGADAAMMTGSGSAVFALFLEENAARSCVEKQKALGENAFFCTLT